MDSQEKMFYTPSDACAYLHITDILLQKWINRLHIETRTLPGMKGLFLTRRDVLLIEENIKHPDNIT